MSLPQGWVVLAHGALGNADEIVFLAVGVLFAGLMLFAWLRTRSAQPEHSTTPESKDSAKAGDATDRFPLE